MAEPVYTDETLDQIIAAAGGLLDGEIEAGSPRDLIGTRTYLRQSRRDALRERLEAAAEDYALSTRIASRPSQAAMADHYAVVESRLYDALRAVLPAGRETRGRLHAVLAMNLRDTDLHQAIIALYRLQRAARSARNRKQTQPKIDRHERNRGDRALDGLMAALIAIWAHVFGRQPGTSVPSGGGRASGPMISFIVAALRPILPQMPSRPAIRARVRRVLRAAERGRSRSRAIRSRAHKVKPKAGKG